MEATIQARTAHYDKTPAIVPIKSIQQVVMMAPDPRYGLRFNDGTGHNRWYLVRRPGMRVSLRFGHEEHIEQE